MNNGYEVRIKQLMDENFKLVDALNLASEANVELQDDLHDLNVQYQDLRAELEDRQHDNFLLDAELEQAQESIDNLTNEVFDLRWQHSQLQAEYDELQWRMEGLEK